MKSLKSNKGGKNDIMKNKIMQNDELLDLVQETLKEDIAEKNSYSFKINGRRVKVVFSDNPSAPTIENALVKIVSRRIG